MNDWMALIVQFLSAYCCSPSYCCSVSSVPPLDRHKTTAPTSRSSGWFWFWVNLASPRVKLPAVLWSSAEGRKEVWHQRRREWTNFLEPVSFSKYGHNYIWSLTCIIFKPTWTVFLYCSQQHWSDQMTDVNKFFITINTDRATLHGIDH